MDFFQTQNYKNLSKHNINNKVNKKRLNEGQVRVLERSFSLDKKLEPERKQELAEQLGIPPRQVAVWYQNKRARWRTQSLELDCSTLQVKLETALAEKRQLERDLEMLRGELEKARQSLFAVVHSQKPCPPPPPTTTTTVCSISEGGSSSGSFSNQYVIDDHRDYHDHDHDHDHDQVLQMDHELFASLIDW